MQDANSHNRWLPLLLFIFALLVAVYPLDIEHRWYRPELMLMLVAYWAISTPGLLGPGTWFCLGLAEDMISGAIWGQQALAAVLVGYLCSLSYQRIRNYTLWQQACWVFVLIGIGEMIQQWVYSLGGGRTGGLYFLWPALISALLWPLFVFLMEQLRVRYRIS